MILVFRVALLIVSCIVSLLLVRLLYNAVNMFLWSVFRRRLSDVLVLHYILVGVLLVLVGSCVFDTFFGCLGVLHF